MRLLSRGYGARAERGPGDGDQSALSVRPDRPARDSPASNLSAASLHAIPSLPRKQESKVASGTLALGARFRGHDENVGSSYVTFATEYSPHCRAAVLLGAAVEKR
jgi:hypothetical protein